MDYSIYEVVQKPKKKDKNAPIVFRDEQNEAIRKTFDFFTKKNLKRNFLWNAKMRFGKTLCALELFRRMTGQDKNYPVPKDFARPKRVILMTHRPAVDNGWKEDFDKIFKGSPDYAYASRSQNAKGTSKTTFDDLERQLKKGEIKGYVFFVSLQFLCRSEEVGGVGAQDEELKALKERIFNAPWDLAILDEAHEGTQTELGQNIEAKLKSNNPHWLSLSGTPFNIRDKYTEESTFVWDYVQEQQAKEKWDKVHLEKDGMFYDSEDNPYIELPRLNLLAFDVSKMAFAKNFLQKSSVSQAAAAFNFNTFLQTWSGREAEFEAAKKANPNLQPGDLVYEDQVNAFLDRLCDDKKDTNYPFAKHEFQDNFNHTFWVVSEVAQAKALEKALKKHDVFGADDGYGNPVFDIINVAGAEGADDALNRVKTAIGKQPTKTRTITISCGRLTTGVTVPEWSAVLLLYGNSDTSLASYMQTVFRVQNPSTFIGENGKTYRKTNAYVFDFAPMRAFKKMCGIAVATKDAVGSKKAQQEHIKELKKYLPCLLLEDGRMEEVDENKLFSEVNNAKIDRILESGFSTNDIFDMENFTTAGIDMKKWDFLYQKVGAIAGTKVKKPEKVEDKKGDVGDEDEDPTPNDPKKGKDKKKGKEEDEEEKKRKKEIRDERKKRADILRAIAVRIPLMLYGGAKKETDEITVGNFTDMIEDRAWEEFMPEGFTKKNFDEFKVCFNASYFRGAGLRYRDILRAADELPVESRIREIARIFSWLKNPDKEKVLTPWRVVNLHLAQTIGGYRFFDENFETQLGEGVPPVWCETDCTKEVFDTVDEKGDMNTRILEINSKTGLYPLFVAYTLYRKNVAQYRKEKIIAETETLTPDEENTLWNEAVERHLYVICNTPMAERITRRTLMGFRKFNDKHIKSIELVEEAQADVDKLARKLLDPNTWKDDMKKGQPKTLTFNAVVGNPPYQRMANGEANGSDPIYHLFIDVGRKLASRGTLIHPGRFLFGAGKTPKDWNEKMLCDNHFKVVKYWVKSNEVFPAVEIKGGVAVTAWDSTTEVEPIKLFTVYPELTSIQKKVSSKGEDSVMDIIYPQTKYNFDTLYADYPKYKKIIGSDGKDKRLRPNAFDKLGVFETKKSEGSVKIHGLIKNKRVTRYIRKQYLIDPLLNFYKVLVPQANGSGAIGEVLSTPIIGTPMTGFTGSFIGFGKFKKPAEAEVCFKYLCTKFSRTMLGILKVTQHNPAPTWRYVPLQDFTSGSDIDWSVSVSEIDEQLYRKYKLTKDEIAFIETNIQPMEG